MWLFLCWPYFLPSGRPTRYTQPPDSSRTARVEEAHLRKPRWRPGVEDAAPPDRAAMRDSAAPQMPEDTTHWTQPRVVRLSVMDDTQSRILYSLFHARVSRGSPIPSRVCDPKETEEDLGALMRSKSGQITHQVMGLCNTSLPPSPPRGVCVPACPPSEPPQEGRHCLLPLHAAGGSPLFSMPPQPCSLDHKLGRGGGGRPRFAIALCR